MSERNGQGTALIIGASRGLGLAIAEEHLKRGWSVTGTVRGNNPTPLHQLAHRSEGRLAIETVDIVEADQVAALARKLAGQSFDLLLVNAGISYGRGDTLAEAGRDKFVRILVTNAYAPMATLDTLEGLVKPDGVLAAMSSGLGSVANNTIGGWETYRASKAALNTMMRSFSAQRPSDRRAMLLIAPGWVRTDMGGPTADLAVEESVPLVVDVLMANRGKPGVRFLDRFGEAMPW
jgi:NAD(P)-dependent dehydrogenase (short-subunit alcohol dehydrogenase family)